MRLRVKPGRMLCRDHDEGSVMSTGPRGGLCDRAVKAWSGQQWIAELDDVKAREAAMFTLLSMERRP